MQDLVSTCFITLGTAELDEMVVARFIQGHEKTARSSLLARNFRSVDEAVNHVDMLEATETITLPQKDATQTPKKQVVTGATANMAASTSKTQTPSVESDELDCNVHECEVDALLDVFVASNDPDDFEDEEDVMEALAARMYKRFPQARKSRKCFYCGAQGHMWMKCYKLLSQLQRNGYQPRPSRGQVSNRGRRGRGYQSHRVSPKPSDRGGRTSTPRNLFGQKDGTSPRKSRNKKKMRSFMEMMDAYMAEGEDEEEEREEDDSDNEQESLNC